MTVVFSVFLAVPWFDLQCVIVVFPDHTHFFVFDQALHGNQIKKNLVQLFNIKSHAIRMEPDHGIDDAIAKYVFDKFVKRNGYVLDNIDT